MVVNNYTQKQYFQGKKVLLAPKNNPNDSNYSEEYEDYEYEEEGSDYHRIVRGYEPLERPWMALIFLHGRLGTGTCGGSLLNQR